MYAEALRNPKSQIIVRLLAERGGVASYHELEEGEIKGSTLVYHLNRLVEAGIVEAKGRGTYQLRYRTPISYLVGSGEKIAYLGLLGEKNGRQTPETEIALRLLEAEGLKTSLKYIVTSPEALSEWSNQKLNYQWILCYSDEIVDIDSVKGKVLPQLLALLKEYVVVMDCTSATKPASIAFYELAKEYLVPLIYIYEKSGTLKWLQSKEDLKHSIGF